MLEYLSHLDPRHYRNKKEFILLLIALIGTYPAYIARDELPPPILVGMIAEIWLKYYSLSNTMQYFTRNLPSDDLTELSRDDVNEIVIYLAKKHKFISPLASIFRHITTYFMPENITALLNSVKHLPYRINANELNNFNETILMQATKIRDERAANFLSELEYEIRKRIDFLEKNGETTRLKKILLAFKSTFENSAQYTLSVKTLKSLDELSNGRFTHFLNHYATISSTAAAYHVLTFSLLSNVWSDYAALLIVKATPISYETLSTTKIPHRDHIFSLACFIAISINMGNWNGFAHCLANFLLTNIGYGLTEKMMVQVERKLSEKKSIQQIKSQYPHTVSTIESLSRAMAHYFVSLLVFKAAEYTKFEKGEEYRQHQHQNSNNREEYKQHEQKQQHNNKQHENSRDRQEYKQNEQKQQHNNDHHKNSRYYQKNEQYDDQSHKQQHHDNHYEYFHYYKEYKRRYDEQSQKQQHNNDQHSKYDKPTSEDNARKLPNQTVRLSDLEEWVLDSRHCKAALDFCKKTIKKVIGVDPSLPNFTSELRKLSLFWHPDKCKVKIDPQVCSEQMRYINGAREAAMQFK